MTIRATIRRIWEPAHPGGRYTVIVRDEEDRVTYVLWSRDGWLCANLYERFVKNQADRPTVTLSFDFASKHLEAMLPLPVAGETQETA